MPELQTLDPDELLWERVQTCLDARRDPFADAELARELAARPVVAARVAALTAGLRRLRRPRRARLAPFAAAALLAVALAAGLWSVRRTPPPAAPRATAIALDVVRGTPPPPRGAQRRLEPKPVLAWTYTGDLP